MSYSPLISKPTADENRQTKQILSKIYSSRFLEGEEASAKELLAKECCLSTLEVDQWLDKLAEKKFVTADGGKLSLTAAGRKQITVVMAGGSFDIIHPGHIETLEKAKSLGDVLIVSVARNVTFVKNKKHPPLHDEKLRRHLVASLRSVDAAVLGSEENIFETVSLLKPDIIALGYDQSHTESAMVTEAGKRGIKVGVVRLDSSVPEIKSSKITRDYF